MLAQSQRKDLEMRNILDLASLEMLHVDMDAIWCYLSASKFRGEEYSKTELTNAQISGRHGFVESIDGRMGWWLSLVGEPGR